MKIKSIISISFFIYIMGSAYVIAQSSCVQLCNENWWRSSSIDIIKRELINSSNLNFKDNYGFRPLHFAVKNGEKDKVGLLLSIGADTNVQTDYGFTPIYFAVGKKGDEEIVKMLIEHGALTNIKDRNGITPLHYAAWGTPNKVKILLEAGADVKAKTNSGKTAFDLGQDNEQLVNSNVYILLKLAND